MLAWILWLICVVLPAYGAEPEARASRVAELRSPDAPSRFEADRVEAEGVLTFVNEADFATFGFLQDGDHGIYIRLDEGLETPRVGERLAVQATVLRGEYAPSLQVHQLVVLGEAGLPAPAVGEVRDRMGSDLDCRWVATAGVVRNVSFDAGGNLHVLRLGGDANAVTVEFPGRVSSETIRDLWGARIEVEGVAAARFNGLRQLLGARVLAPGLRHVRVLDRPPPDLASLPEQRLDELLQYGRPTGPTGLVLVRGVVTYRSAGNLIIQDEAGTSAVRLIDGGTPPAVGERASLVGYAEAAGLTPRLADARVVASEPGVLPAPERIASVWAPESALRRVRISGLVLAVSKQQSASTLTLGVDGRSVGVRVGGELAPSVLTGAIVDVVGVVQQQSDPFHPVRAADAYASLAQDVQLLVNQPDDVVVVQAPPFWTPFRAAFVVGALILVLGVATGIVGVLRHQVARQTRQIRDQLAAQARLSLEAQAANRAKSRFLATMSHELRTPLHGILGSLSILRESTTLSTDDRELVELVHDSGAQLSRLVGEVLDLSKAEAGQLSVRRAPVDIRRLVEACTQEVRELAVGKGLYLRVDVDEAVPHSVSTDALRLRQVLSNLLTNAVKFTEHGGVTIRVWPASEFLVLSVQDTGPGIPTELHEAVFTPFRQADEGVERTYGGTGLGLAICREICVLLGGEITVRSEPGEGATFEVRVLAPASERAPSPKPAPRPASLAGLRVLVADDNLVNRTIIQSMLGQLGVDATVVEDGLQAVELLRGGPEFDLVLLDLHMPVLGGLAAARQIRLAMGEDVPPILALTADALDQTRRSCIDAGMRGVITKPVTLEQLRGSLSEAMRQRRAGLKALIQ